MVQSVIGIAEAEALLDRTAKPGALSGRLGGDERLEGALA
jgi:hypothetical protein